MTSKEDMIKFVVMQTDYTEEVAEEKLKEHAHNYIKVIKEYLSPHKNTEPPPTKRSINERMMDELRTFMDTSNRQYIQRKEYKEKNEEIQKNIYKKFLEQKKLHTNCIYLPPNQNSCTKDCSNPMCPGLLGEDNTYIKTPLSDKIEDVSDVTN